MLCVFWRGVSIGRVEWRGVSWGSGRVECECVVWVAGDVLDERLFSF